MTMEKLRRATKILDAVTPLRIDCGRLCHAACCKGEGEIWLLPGEEKLYANNPGFTVKSYETEQGTNSIHVICKENCWFNREIRPFFCKIFPLYPLIMVDEYERIRIRLVLDPRGGSLCPLFSRPEKITRTFQKKVRLAVRLLCRDPEMLTFFRESGDFLLAMEELKQQLISTEAPWESL
jgi:hypothetical protein